MHRTIRSTSSKLPTADFGSTLVKRSAFAAALGLPLLGALLTGCGDPPPLYGDPTQQTVGANPNMMMPPAVVPAAYPAGPYSNKEGFVMPNLTFSGYRLLPKVTDRNGLKWDDTIALEDYHADPKVKCLVISMGATWCGACQQEQPALIADVSNDESFAVLNILQEGPQQGKVATVDDVNQWVDHFHQNFFVTKGTAKTGMLWQGYGTPTQGGGGTTIGLPFNFVIRTDTMKIVTTVMGFDPQIHDSAMAACAQ